MKILYDEVQDSKTVYSFARIDFCSKYISFALLKLLSTRTFVLLPIETYSPGPVLRANYQSQSNN